MDIRVWLRSVRRQAQLGALWAMALLMLSVPTALAASGSGSGGGGGGGNNPPPSTPPVFQSITFTPATVVGGGGATGKVQFSGPTDGAAVRLTSSNPAVVQVPDEAVVIRLASSGTFPVSTSPVSATTTVTITGSVFGGATRTATITVTPGQPPAPDTVRVTRATWSKGLLRIEATSTNPNAVLEVHHPDGTFAFTLTNNGGGRYSDQRGWVTNPLPMIVTSNFGGSARTS
jgi:hypothetical protein